MKSITDIRKAGRPKLWTETILLKCATGTKAALDAALVEGEDRSALIRQALDRELKRRRKLK